MSETKVVSFPTARGARLPKDDATLAVDVQKAWRKLWRTIKAARAAGLDVRTDFGEGAKPEITRKL